jgi:tetratricopeptide (TPR) repeat protein
LTHECTGLRECYEAGRRFWDNGNKVDAMRVWDRASRQFPTEAWLIRNVARARYDLADYPGAIIAYMRAMALSPFDTAIRTDLAWAMLAASRFAEARQICNEVLAREPENVAARTILARLPQ